MKLKKIASLMLAGVMAVSMLAACGDNSSTTTPVVPPVDDNTATSAISDALNDQLFSKQADLLSFESNSKLASLLDRIAEDDEDFEIRDTLVSGAGRPTLLAPNGVNADITNIVNAAFNGTNPAVTMTNVDILVNHDDNRAYLYVYTVDGSMQDVDQIARAVMNGVNGLQDHVYDVAGIVDNGTIPPQTDYEYKGYAEMVKITNDNSSDTAWVVAVLVEQHAVSNT